MLRQLRRVVVDDRRLDELVRLLVQLLGHCFYMVNLVLVHRLRVEENPHLLVDEILVDVQQNLGVLNLDVVRSFLDVVHQVVVEVDVELRHQLKMDYFLDAAGEELRHRLKMDCFLDAVQALVLQQLVHLPAHE